MQKLINAQGYEKKFNIPLFLVVSLLFLPKISANDLDCSLIPTYYKNSVPILVYDNSTSFDGISFSSQCSNNLPTQRILALSITNSSPIELTNALPKNTIPYLRILEKDKTLWNSDIISTKNFNESVNFSISIIAVSEGNFTLEQVVISKEILMNKEQTNQLINFGSGIMPSNPIVGVGIAIALGIAVIYSLYYYEVGKRMGSWKRKKQLKKMDKQQQEERWKNQRR